MDVTTLKQAKNYTDKTAAQFGGLKGANCKISSVTSVTGGNKVTFSWKNDSDETQTSDLTVLNGEKGEKGEKGDTGDDYVLTAQDKADIADLVLAELPTAESIEV